MNVLKRALNLTNKNIILVCLLMMFSLISTVFVSLFKTITLQVIMLYILMMVAFFAGFFNSVKVLIKGENAKLSFLEGVGEYFLPMLGIGLMLFGAYTFFAGIALQYCIGLAGGKEVVLKALNELLPMLQSASTPVTMNPDSASVKVYLIIMLSIWVAWGLLSFVTLYWVPVVLLDNERNIFKSFWVGLKFLFKNFFKTFALFMGIILLLVIITIMGAIATVFIPLLDFVFFTLCYYIAVMFLFSIFLMYADNREF